MPAVHQLPTGGKCRQPRRCGGRLRLPFASEPERIICLQASAASTRYDVLSFCPDQLGSISQRCTHGFTDSAVQYLRYRHPDMCKERDLATLHAYVEAMLVFASHYGISQQGNVLRLMDLQVKHRFGSQLSGYLHQRLSQQGLDESTRVYHFMLALDLPVQPRVISLDTDLQALGADRG
jgi:hypothetical protein